MDAALHVVSVLRTLQSDRFLLAYTDRLTPFELGLAGARLFYQLPPRRAAFTNTEHVLSVSSSSLSPVGFVSDARRDKPTHEAAACAGTGGEVAKWDICCARVYFLSASPHRTRTALLHFHFISFYSLIRVPHSPQGPHLDYASTARDCCK